MTIIIWESLEFCSLCSLDIICYLMLVFCYSLPTTKGSQSEKNTNGEALTESNIIIKNLTI